MAGSADEQVASTGFRGRGLRYHPGMSASVLGTSLFGLAFWFGAPLVVRALGHSPRIRARGWLVAAIAAVAVAWHLPSPFFVDHTATFSKHAVGGGLASVCVAYYLLHHAEGTTLARRALAVLAVVSVLGVFNELFELVLDALRGTRLAADASWDLLANTMGATVAFGVIETGRTLGGTHAE